MYIRRAISVPLLSGKISMVYSSSERGWDCEELVVCELVNLS